MKMETKTYKVKRSKLDDLLKFEQQMKAVTNYLIKKNNINCKSIDFMLYPFSNDDYIKIKIQIHDKIDIYHEFTMSLQTPTITQTFRSFDEIMKDANNAKSFGELMEYANELFAHKKKYTLIQIEFAVEYFEELKEKLTISEHF